VTAATPGPAAVAVLATKLFPPARRSALVARPRLAERMAGAHGGGHRLTLVSAPAGFGKTVLLGEWTAGHERVGWLSLDEGDNALPRFLAHLGAALAGIGLAVDVGNGREGEPPSAIMTALVNQLVRAGEHLPDERWLLVLDDYHVIDAPEVHESVVFLLDHAPDRLCLLVATRSDPPFPLSRLRSRGQLVEIRAADLRFAPAEARAFLVDVMGVPLTDGDVRALEQRTEGWVAGLQLAALSLRGMPDRAEVAGFIGDFTGSHRFVVDYLVDEVLARQEQPTREFLLRTAILDRLTGPLCDAVTGGTDGARMLDELDRGDVFLVPLDGRRSWYRYHHLFRDVLRVRLDAEHPEQVAALHRAASDWFAAHRCDEEAVAHALAAGDDDRAAHLIESALPELRRARRDTLLLGWTRSLPEAVLRRRPVLAILSGWSLMMAGDLDGMERRLDDADAALAAGARDPALAATWPDTEDLRTAPATVPVYRAALAQARGDVAGTVRHARRAQDLAGPDDHVVRGASAGFLGLAAWAAGDIEEALSTFSQAVGHLHAAGNLTDELDATIVLADMWITAGRPLRARRLYEQALRTATGRGEPFPRTTADLHVGLAERDRERNDLAGALARLATADALAEHGSITENRHRRFVARAQLHAAAGEHAAAGPLLDEAEALYRPGFYPDVRPLPAVRARIDLAGGDVDAAERWARDHDVTAADPATFLREYELLTLARLLLARRTARALDEVASLLDRLRAAAAPARAGSLLEIGVLRALERHAGGHRREALDELHRALARTPEPDGHVRLLLDEGAPMLALLEDASDPAAPEPLRERARHLLASARGAERPPAGPATLPDPLSEREREVLRLLGGDLTGPEIARHLYVSVNTLRTHTKRIFTKLDVGNRSAAVRRGRELGLL
jgi:LuxR family maltose regulon positive regulatory protein